MDQRARAAPAARHRPLRGAWPRSGARRQAACVLRQRRPRQLRRHDAHAGRAAVQAARGQWHSRAGGVSEGGLLPSASRQRGDRLAGRSAQGFRPCRRASDRRRHPSGLRVRPGQRLHRRPDRAHRGTRRACAGLLQPGDGCGRRAAHGRARRQAHRRRAHQRPDHAQCGGPQGGVRNARHSGAAGHALPQGRRAGLGARSAWHQPDRYALLPGATRTCRCQRPDAGRRHVA